MNDSIELSAKNEILSQGRSNKEDELYHLYNSKLLNKSLLIETFYEGAPSPISSTGFLVKKNNTIYLVTNYHVIPAKNLSDTSLKENPDFPMPTNARIYFHLIDGRKSYPIEYKFDTLKIYRVPNLSKKMNGVVLPRSIIDLVFIPLYNLPSQIIIDTIDVKNGFHEPKIKENTLISIWGYAHDPLSDEKYCSVDTSLTYFNDINDYVHFKYSKSLKGNSGSPVYYHFGSNYCFAGIHSFTMQRTNNSTGAIEQRIGAFLSATTISKSLDKYVP